MRQKKSSGRIYIDVNVLYYYLTAHEEFGERSKDLIERYALATSALTIWLLYVLTKLENVATILEELEIEILPLTSEIFEKARMLKKPKDFEDRIHLATMLEHGIEIILSNDKDFDEIPKIRRIF
ncbi:type II toxin-antitoxin system VapC family toxin [Ferroglobus sp.]|uniref:type II toxin-antitoxin system VapC family toxin n=1 Tax=Ferroglobus sp. TaxID=2614230 RepID=UPI0025B95269|nr:type II toxin-antitoxin system VapC family toxin [Ferroglobus sp.]